MGRSNSFDHRGKHVSGGHVGVVGHRAMETRLTGSKKVTVPSSGYERVTVRKEAYEALASTDACGGARGVLVFFSGRWGRHISRRLLDKSSGPKKGNQISSYFHVAGKKSVTV